MGWSISKKGPRHCEEVSLIVGVILVYVTLSGKKIGEARALRIFVNIYEF